MAKPWEEFTPQQDEFSDAPWRQFLNKFPEPRSNGLSEEEFQAEIQRGLRQKVSRDRVTEARNMGLGQRTLLSAGRETDKLLAGSANIGDFLADVVGDPNAMGRTVARSQEQASKDELTQELLDNLGAGQLGAMLPYIATGSLAGPAARNAVNAVSQGANRAVTAAGTTSRSLARKATDTLAARPGAPGVVGQRLNQEIMDPLAKWSVARSNRLPQYSPYRQGAMADVFGGAGLGVVEGAVHYDNSAVDGGIAGLMGGITGQALRPILTKAPNYNTTNQQEVIDWAESKGMQFLPGLRKGAIRDQKFEQGLRNDGDWADLVGRYDRNNQSIMNKVALEAAGFNGEIANDITAPAMRQHLDSLKEQYQSIESRSVGRFDRSEITALNEHAQKFKYLKSKEGQEAFGVAQDLNKKFRDMYSVVRDEKGRFQQATFDGSQYQGLRRELKQKIEAAHNNNKPEIVQALQPYMTALDSAMDRGVRTNGGDATASQWRDLNERYAMTHLLMDNGLNTLGRFDGDKMRSFFQSNDMQRILLGEGGRVKELHKLAQLNQMMKDSQKSDILGTNLNPLRNSGKQSYVQRLLNFGPTKMMPILPETMLKLYEKGIPGQTGLLNMNNKGIWSPQLYSRAMSQGTQFHPGLIETGSNVFDNIMGLFPSSVEEHQQ